MIPAGEGWNSCWPEAALCPLCACRPLCASICFPICLCRPVFPLPLSAILFVFLPTFARPPLPFRLWCSPFSLRSVGTPCLCPPASPFHRCRPPFSTRSVRLSFSLASSPPTFPFASVRLSFPYLSLSASPFHLCRPPFSARSVRLSFSPASSPPDFSFASVRLSFLLPLSVRFSFPPLSSAVFYAFWQSVSPPLFSFASRRPFFSPLSSALLSLCLCLHTFFASVRPLFLFPVTRRSS